MEIKKQRAQKIALFRRVLCALRVHCVRVYFCFCANWLVGRTFGGCPVSRAWVLGMALLFGFVYGFVVCAAPCKVIRLRKRKKTKANTLRLLLLLLLQRAACNMRPFLDVCQNSHPLITHRRHLRRRPRGIPCPIPSHQLHGRPRKIFIHEDRALIKCPNGRLTNCLLCVCVCVCSVRLTTFVASAISECFLHLTRLIIVPAQGQELICLLAFRALYWR